MIDHGMKNTTFASMAKLFAAEMSNKVVNDAVQVFGGMGYNEVRTRCRLEASTHLSLCWLHLKQLQLFVCTAFLRPATLCDIAH